MIFDFKDCEYRYMENDVIYCQNKLDKDDRCDNCKGNFHLNCDNYNGSKDYCLKFFKENISELKECQEKTVFSDKELSKKCSN